MCCHGFFFGVLFFCSANKAEKTTTLIITELSLTAGINAYMQHVNICYNITDAMRLQQAFPLATIQGFYRTQKKENDHTIASNDMMEDKHNLYFFKYSY